MGTVRLRPTLVWERAPLLRHCQHMRFCKVIELRRDARFSSVPPKIYHIGHCHWHLASHHQNDSVLSAAQHQMGRHTLTSMRGVKYTAAFLRPEIVACRCHS